MSKKSVCSLVLILTGLFVYTSASAVTLYTYLNGGSTGQWNVAGTWTTDPTGLTLTGSAVPANNDVLYILNGFTVVLSANVATTGHTIVINSGGTLDLSTFTVTTISNLSGSGTLKIGAGYFPTITTNNFVNSFASGATVEYYDFTGTLPVSVNFPNLTFTNTTATNHTITFSNASAYSFTIFRNLVTRTTGTGTLAINIGTQNTNVINLTINGSVTIGSNTSWGVGAFNATHTITLLGNMTNNGTVDLCNGTQYAAAAANSGAATFSFTGATDNTLACNGITDFFNLTVNKGTGSANTLSVTSTNVANLRFFTSGQLFTITNGTLRLGTNISIPRVYGSGTANYDIGSTTLSPMLWIDGADVNTNGSALVVYGKFRISSGTFTSVSGQGTVIREEGQYIIEGGTFTTEKFRPSSTASTHRGSFTMTGGTVNANGTTGSDNSYARFSLPYPEQVFIMSGGTINVSNPQPNGTAASGGIHIGVKAANYNVTGGTFNAILSGATVTFFDILSTAPFWDLNIQRTGGTPTTARLNGIGSLTGAINTAQPLVVLNNFTIDGANTPVFNANNLNVTVGRNFTISSGGTYQPTVNTTIFNGSADQVFTNDGTISAALNNLTVSKSAGTLTLSGAASVFTVTNDLEITGGVLNDGGKTLQVAGDIHNESVHTGTGSITLNGVTTQTISGNGSGVFGNLVLNNNSSPGVQATADLSVSGVLTLAGAGNSLFDIAQNQLALTSVSVAAVTTTGAGFSSTKMITTLGLQSDKGIRKTFGNLSAFTFPFGVGSTYTPATIQLTSAPTTYGTIAARPVGSRHQFVVAGNTNNLMWYWKVVSSGFTGVAAGSVSHTYTYAEASVAPAGDDATYVPARYNATAWTVINDLTQVNETTNTISVTGVGYIDGDYTAGRPGAFGVVLIYYSKRNGNWSDTGAGTTPWSNVSHTGADATTTPGPGDQVFIGDGGTNNHVITITANGQNAGGLEINAGSTLDVGIYTGHNFGRLENVPILGSGLLRISSASATAEFPAGDFGNFIRTSGGTVEYYTTGTQDFTIPLSSAAPTNLPLITYRNLIMTPGTGRSVTLPNQDLRVYGNMTVQGAPTGVARINGGSTAELTINGNLLVSSGTLQFINGTAQTVDIDGNLTVSSGAVFNLASSGTVVTNLLTLDGNIVNNGTLDFANGSYVCNVTMTSAVNSSITGSGATTDFNILTVNKGSSQTPVLEVNASAFTLSGGANPLVLNNGTFRLTSSQTVTIAIGADFNIPATTRLSANGGTLQISGGDGIDLLLAGTLEVLNGTVNVGTTANNNSIEYAATGSPTITSTGGSLNVRGQVRRSTAGSQGGLLYNQSGAGVVTVAISSAAATTRGVFEILNTGSSFTMTGGTLAISRASGSTSIADVYLQPASFTVTGGTLEIGTGGTSQTIDINSTIPLFNVSVTGTTNTARQETNGLTMRGSLTIGNGNIFQASSLNVSIAGDLINQNTTATTGVAVGGYRAGATTQTTTLNGSTGNQLITGVAGNLTNFGNLVISNTFLAGSVTLSANTNLRVNGTLTLTSGTLADGGNTITAISSVSNSATHTSSVGGSITLAGTSAQFVGGNGAGKFGNVILNNASGAFFGSNQEITGVLTFTAGSLTIGTYSLNLSNTALTAIVGSSSSRYIITSGLLSDGGITKAFAGSLSAAAFTYPIGVGSKYTPVSYEITTGTTGGNVTLKPVNSKHPSATGPGTAFINYYWNVNSTIVNLIALTHTYTYVAADEAGVATDYRDARFSGGAWTIGVTAGNPNTVSRIITFTNVDLNGDYTAGEATAFVNPTTYTSIASGSWESDLAVWDIDPPGTNLGPPAGSFVIISEGHTVTITANSKTLATLEVRGRLHVGTTTGHNFGTVTTSGAGDRTIQFQSSTFPAADFTSFTAVNGGTIEYNGALTLPTQPVYNNLSFTGAGVKILSNTDLTVNGHFTVSGGTVNNSVNNRNITLTNAAGDFTNNATFVAGSGGIVVGRNFINQGAAANFVAGSGTAGLRIAGNFLNNTSATFTMGTDSLGVRGTLTNSAVFTGGAGAIRVSGNVNNTGGTFTSGSGGLTVSGSVSNSATFQAGTGVITIAGSLTNSGASATYNAASNVTTISGNIDNNSGSTFNAGTSAITLRGNWNNGATFNAGTGTVTFSNTAARTLTGATTFNNLTKTLAGNLTLNNSITVNGALTLTSGNLVTGSNTVHVTNTAVQPVSGSVNSFVDGRLIISYPNTAATSRTFPIGKGSIYRPVVIQQTVASTLPVLQVEMINTPPTGSFPSTLEGISEARYYAVSLLSGVMNSPTVELNFNTNAPTDESVSVAGNVRIVRATVSTGPWTDEGGSGVFSPAAPAGYATSGVTSVAAATFFAIGYENQVLPITLKYFTATPGAAGVDLKWVTVTETNNDYFTVERSRDGIHFDSLLAVAGAGTTKELQTYYAVDNKPLLGTSYYRLKQTDYDGSHAYSDVVRVYMSNLVDPEAILYPNPVLPGNRECYVKIIGAYFDQVFIRVTHSSGKVMFAGLVPINAEADIPLHTLVPALTGGVYIVNLAASDFIDVKKLVIAD